MPFPAKRESYGKNLLRKLTLDGILSRINTTVAFMPRNESPWGAPAKRIGDCTFGDSLRKALPCYHACLANSRFIGCLVGSLLCGSFAFRLLADFRAVRVPELVCIPAKRAGDCTFGDFAVSQREPSARCRRKRRTFARRRQVAA